MGHAEHGDPAAGAHPRGDAGQAGRLLPQTPQVGFLVVHRFSLCSFRHTSGDPALAAAG